MALQGTRIRDLPAATVPLGGEEELPLAQFRLGVWETVRVSVDNLAALVASAADPFAAAAAASAAEAAASAASANGVVILATTPNTGLEYIATGAVGPVAGRRAQFTPNVDNTGDCFLTWNGTRRRLRPSIGTGTLAAGLLRAGIALDVYDNGSSFVVLTVPLTMRFQQRVNMVGASATLDGKLTDAGSVLARLGGFSVGSLWGQVSDGAGGLETAFWVYGAGTVGRETGEFRAFYKASFDGAVAVGGAVTVEGNIRSTGGQILDARNRQVYSLFNPPPFQADMAEHVAQATGRESLDYGNEQVLLDDGVTYQLSPPDARRLIRVNAAMVMTGHHLGPGDEVDVEVESGGSVVLHSGYTGATRGSAPMAFRGFGGATKLLLPATWSGKVRRRQSTITLAPDLNAPSVVASVAAIPAYSRGIIWVGQSWADQESDSAVAGLQAEFRRLGIGAGVLSVRFSAAGASGLWKAGVQASDPLSTNYWWDEDASTGGPNAINCVAAVQAALAAEGAPAIGDFYAVVIYGLPDLSVLSGSGYYTPAQWTADQIALQNWIRAELAAPNLKFIVCPVPPQDTGAFPVKAFGPLRQAALQVAADDADSHRGPSLVGLLRPFNNRHHYLRGREDHGRLLARCIANLEGGSEYEGPRPISCVRVSTNLFRFQVDRRGGTALTRPAVPVGIGIVLGGDPLAARLTIDPMGYVWGTDGGGYDTLDVETSGDDGVTAFDAYWPDGAGAEYQQHSATVFAYDGLGLPVWLQDYHPSV